LTSGRIFGFLGSRLFFQIVQIRQTKAATHSSNMKLNVLFCGRGQCTQQKTTQFSASRAAQTFSLPDFADGTASLITLANLAADSQSQRFILTELIFECRHFVSRQSLIQPRSQFTVTPGRHGVFRN
jgi:hypothetical protein